MRRNIMAGSLNRATLIGHVGLDPEIRKTNEGKEIATFGLATTETWRDKNTNERKDKTEWHRIVVFNDGLVNIIKNYVKKGNKILIEGSLQTRKWNDNAGNEKYTTEIVLQNYNSNLMLLDSRANIESDASSIKSPMGTGVSSTPLNDDDIPF